MVPANRLHVMTRVPRGIEHNNTACADQIYTKTSRPKTNSEISLTVRDKIILFFTAHAG